MTINSQLDQAAALLRQGRLVAFPTETVYGLGANALDPAAVQRIFQAKGRPATSPLIVHVCDEAMALEVVSDWSEVAKRLGDRFWPGPLTLVLPKRPTVPDSVTAGLPTVGIRVPAHPMALELIRRTGLPLAAPSANRFTQLSPTTAEHVRQSLGDRVDLVLDGGPCLVGIESTVLSLATDPPTLLRPGMIGREQLESLIGPLQLASAALDGAAHLSPGQHSRHYAPQTPLRFGVPGTSDTAVGYIWHAVPAAAMAAIEMPSDPSGYATAIYDTLHRLDALGLTAIYVEPLPDAAGWEAVRDRLRRAAAVG